MFGQPSTAAAASSGGFFGAAAPPPSSGIVPSFNFGGASAMQQPPPSTNLFNISTPTAATSTPSLFSSFPSAPATSTTFSFTGLGASTTTTASGLFGQPMTSTSLFSQPTAATPWGGTTSGLFNQPQQQQMAIAQQHQQLQQQQQIDTFAKMVLAIRQPQLHGDERDEVIAAFNRLQIFCGTGKGYFYPGAPPVDFTAENPFCRFKAVGYSCRLGYTDADGCVGLTLKTSYDDVQRQQQLLLDAIYRLMGNRPTLTAHLEGLRPLPDNKCEAVIYVTESPPPGQLGLKQRIPARKLSEFLCGNQIRPQLQSQLQCENIVLKIDMENDELNRHLANPPAGLDATIWRQAQLDNPDPKRLIPIQIVSWEQLRQRHKLQVQQTEQQKQMIEVLCDRLTNLERKVSNTQSLITHYRHNTNQLSHRLLKFVLDQQSLAKLGRALNEQEEALRTKLEMLCAHLVAPNKAKMRLGELSSLVRCQPDALRIKNVGRLQEQQLDADSEYEIRRMLKKFQETLENVVSTTKTDKKCLKVLSNYLGSNRAGSSSGAVLAEPNSVFLRGRGPTF